MKKSLFIFFFLSINSLFLFAKDLPLGYGGVELGMSFDSAKSALQQNSEFGYHGDRDVSLLPGENRKLIQTSSEKGFGSYYLKDCWFQFYDEKLYIIMINLNPIKMDYYSVFTNLCEKYGEPVSLDPERAVWKNSSVTMSLEKPLMLKYVDNATFEELQNQSNIDPSVTEMSREQFLEGL